MHGIISWGAVAAEQDLRRLNIDVVHPALRIALGTKKWCRIENLY